jgi:RNA polymerase sigma-70 factor (ECF subfamily)
MIGATPPLATLRILMSARPDVLERLERFRPYLRVLAQLQLGPRWHVRHDPSDLVQQTLVRAVAAAEQFRGQDEAELAGWLRRILANTLENVLRDLHRDRRDVRRERSLEADLAASSVRLVGLLADPAASPSEQLVHHERLLRMAAALGELLADQREAIERHYLHGEKLHAVAAAMERTPAAVAGLIKRGMKQLRERMEE